MVVGGTALAALLPPLAWGAEWGDAFYRAMTLLVVASPCALVISTPSAILSGIANGARHGVLFKGGAYLDLAGTIDTIAFDKTGTLTIGAAAPGPGMSRDDQERVSPPASGAPTTTRFSGSPPRWSSPPSTTWHERSSTPRSSGGSTVPSARAFASFPGEGVVGWWRGGQVWVGNATMAERQGQPAPQLMQGWTAQQTSLGRSVVYVGIGVRRQAAMSFGDTLKPNAAAAVRHLKYEGVRWITVLSGDHPDAVRASPPRSARTKSGQDCSRTRRSTRSAMLAQSSARRGDGG
jgi:Zn2+/Cd2+-exporting ATPase